MTLDQKAQLVIGTGMFFEMPDSLQKLMPPGFGGDVNSKDPVYNAMVKKIRKYLPGAAGFSSEFPELGIATQVLSDGPAGLRIQPTRTAQTGLLRTTTALEPRTFLLVDGGSSCPYFQTSRTSEA